MRYCFDEWQEHVRVFYEADPMGSRDHFQSDLDFVQNGGLIFSYSQFSATRFDHNPKLLKGVDHEFLLYERYLEGRGRGLVDETTMWVDGKWIQVVDMSRRFRNMTSDVLTRGVLIPHAAIGYDPSRHAPYFSARLTSKVGRLLDFAHQEMYKAVDAGRDDASVLISAFKLLLRQHFLQQTGLRDQYRTTREREALVKAFIDRNLRCSDLSPEFIMREMGLSRTSLYRLFEAEGGIVRYIADCRLDRCMADLADAPARRGQVRRVAEAWGFYHPGNFNRRFRERFEAAPTEFLAASTPSTKPSLNNTRYHVHKWVQAS